MMGIINPEEKSTKQSVALKGRQGCIKPHWYYANNLVKW
jgi:hypothetical protein